jgi:hypothetical protein
LLANDGGMLIRTQRLKKILYEVRRYAVEIGSDAMTYLPSFIRTGSDIHNLIWKYIYKQTGRRSHKPTLSNNAEDEIAEMFSKL